MAQRRRQDLIMERIQKSGFVTTEELVEQFNVTPQTIRRDLNELAKKNTLRRHHGGAGIDSSTVNTSYQTRKILDLEAKGRIAEALVELIPDNSSIFINIGTTTETIARALLRKNNLRIVTNNLHVATILSAREGLSCDHRRRRFGIAMVASWVRRRGTLSTSSRWTSESSAPVVSTAMGHCSISTIARFGWPSQLSPIRLECCWRRTIPSSVGMQWFGSGT